MIWILFIGTMALSLWAMWRVKSVYNRYNQGEVRSGITGGEAAAEILRRSGIRDVEITHAEGMLGDHYDPLHKRLVLSEANYFGRTPAALGVAAHECGHAIQHQLAYKPLHWRMAAVGITTYANHVVMFLPLLGLFTGLIAPRQGGAGEFRIHCVWRRSHRCEAGAGCGGLDLCRRIHHLAGVFPLVFAAAPVGRWPFPRLTNQPSNNTYYDNDHAIEPATPEPPLSGHFGFVGGETNPRPRPGAAD